MEDKRNKFIPENLCYYLSVKSLPKIIKSGYFCVSNIKEMNDLDEGRGLSEEEKKKIFCLCLNAGKHENVPLWYLYSGIKGDGIRLEFTRSKIENLIEEIDTVYCCNEDFSLRKRKKPFKNKIDFDIEFDWICYKNTNGDKYFYKNKWVPDTSLGFFPKKYFVKDCAWRFENEFRIIFKFKKDPKCIKIGIPNLVKIIKSISIRMAPEADESTRTKLEEQGLKKVHMSNLNCHMK